MPPTFRDDPYGAYNFVVIVNGVSDDGTAVKAGCSEVSGLETEVTPVEYRNGNEDITVRKIPGLKKFMNITLKRGMTGDLAMWNWIRNAMKGQVVRAAGQHHHARRESPARAALELHARAGRASTPAQATTRPTTRPLSRPSRSATRVSRSTARARAMALPAAQSPGVRLQFVRPAEDSNTLRTDIAAFAGPTERGPVGELVRIADWREYLSRFGEFSERATTAFALRGYFENEGDIAYVVRTAASAVVAWTDWSVGDLDPVTRAWLPSAPASGGFAAARYRIEASSPGLWANGLEVQFSYRRVGARGAPEVDLVVRPRQGAAEVLSGLSPATLVADVAERSIFIRLRPDPAATAVAAPHLGPLSFTWDPLRLGGGDEQPPGRAEYQSAVELMLAEPEAALLAFPDIHSMNALPADRDAILAAAVIGAEQRLDRQVLATPPPRVRRTDDVAGWVATQRQIVGDRGARTLAIYHPGVDVDNPLAGPDCAAADDLRCRPRGGCRAAGSIASAAHITPRQMRRSMAPSTWPITSPLSSTAC